MLRNKALLLLFSLSLLLVALFAVQACAFENYSPEWKFMVSYVPPPVVYGTPPPPPPPPPPGYHRHVPPPIYYRPAPPPIPPHIARSEIIRLERERRERARRDQIRWEREKRARARARRRW